MSLPVKLLVQTAFAAATSDGSQNFLGARWISSSLELVPKDQRRPLALRYLALSPHYFYRTEQNAQLSKHDFLEYEVDRNRLSRQRIIDGIVSRYLSPGFTCLDYGCGPGFLAYAAAPKVDRVIACDISRGVLACARAINPRPNIEYRLIAPDGSIPVTDGSVDLVYSFAVLQHVTDETFRGILKEIRRTLKSTGKVVCHLVLDGQPGWRPEAAWRADRTVRGRIKWRFGLRCFSRSQASIQRLILDAGFTSPEIISIADLGLDLAGEDIPKQHLCVFTR
jgi:SAM-dependent methyltransferase